GGHRCFSELRVAAGAVGVGARIRAQWARARPLELPGGPQGRADVRDERAAARINTGWARARGVDHASVGWGAASRSTRVEHARRAHDAWNTPEEREHVLRLLAQARVVYAEQAGAR